MLHFLGIGAQKCGTTWIHANLARDPRVFLPEFKEVHFWDKRLARGIDWYLSLFPDGNGKINGEITSAYAILDRDTICKVREVNPALRQLYSLRDPRSRAWSCAGASARTMKRQTAGSSRNSTATLP